ncbi:exonuclease domain-containing protein [Natronoglycomyces albus]|uniref:3'-5' exonuclease n=1 Tax=Natronoglycomyces albus TaxID=2811108 RepID=A0A895XJ35_9ACTN|nr:exonuclease domain-containing protein [Natronoglycomyces albus]QSB04987.1 3'-5' exonuclease [Natronoglycomyces albus]
MNEITWCEGPLIGFDTETTGVRTDSDRIVTAALTQDAGARTWLINPGVPIPPGASAVHGITDDIAQRDGVAPEKALAEISEHLNAAAEDGTPIVAFRAGFDLTMLSYELDRHGLAQLPWDQLRVIDPSVLDKQADRFRRGKRKLENVCEHYAVSLQDWHTAEADAQAAVALARAIGRTFPDLARLAPADLHAAQVGWFAEDAASLEAFFRSKGRDETVDRRWPLSR